MKQHHVLLLCAYSAYLPLLLLAIWNHFQGGWENTAYGLFLLVPTFIVWIGDQFL